MQSRVLKGVLVAALMFAAGSLIPAAASANLLGSFSAAITDENGDEVTQAGARPFEVENTIGIAAVPPPASSGLPPFFTVPSGNLKDAVVDLPVGFVGDPNRIPRCSVADLTVQECPLGTRVGTFTLTMPMFPSQGDTSVSGIFNLAPRAGEPARFGTVVENAGNIYFDAEVRPGDSGITISSTDIPLQPFALVQTSEVRMWGVPADPAHDAERGGPAGYEPIPFLTMPTECSGEPLVTKVSVRSWQELDAWDDGEYVSPPLEGCDRLDFDPDVKVQPQSTAADSPSAYVVELEQAQSSSPDSLSTAHLKDATVSLPEGVAINPAAAEGLGSCGENQFGLGEEGKPSCPVDSTIGQVRIETPLLDEPLVGPVFQAEQGENPFDSLLAIYMAPASERYGVRIKLAGEVKLDPETGRLTSSFLNNPQLPFSKLRLSLKGGNRAVLANPATCGPKTTDWTISSWAQPGSPVEGSDTFEITTGPGGAPCAASDSDRDFDLELLAGMVNPNAGEYSPFVLRLTKPDGRQDLRDLRVDLPEGLTGKLAGIPYCSEAALSSLNGSPNTALGSAAAEIDSPACPQASQIGRVTVGAGVGPSPYYLQTGKAYLAGPYKGAPLSLAVVAPVNAGPFDLGNVMVRSAIDVNERTAELTVASDEIPTMLEGIPLKIRDLRVILDREDFTLNPTNCAAKQIRATVGGTGNTSAELSNAFGAANCSSLGFSPRFGMRILNKGRRSTLRSFNPAMRFVVAPRTGDANLGPTRVVLPSPVILDQSHIRTVCTRPQFAERNCPEGSIYGYARAWSPLLDRPVQGPVYLGSSSNQLPDLIADLDGQVRIVLQGRIDTAKGGRLRTTFAQVPDVPVSRFALNMRGGERGILVNSTDLCRSAQRGVAAIRGQNGKVHRTRPAIHTAFRGCKKVRRKVARRKSQAQGSQLAQRLTGRP